MTKGWIVVAHVLSSHQTLWELNRKGTLKNILQIATAHKVEIPSNICLLRLRFAEAQKPWLSSTLYWKALALTCSKQKAYPVQIDRKWITNMELQRSLKQSTKMTNRSEPSFHSQFEEALEHSFQIEKSLSVPKTWMCTNKILWRMWHCWYF